VNNLHFKSHFNFLKLTDSRNFKTWWIYC